VLRVTVKLLAAIFIWGIAAGSALAERKIAFVVGIDKYDNLGPHRLPRVVNDRAPRSPICIPHQDT